MRTTLAIDDDVLLAAKDAARRQRTSVGQALSAMARQGLLAAPMATTGARPPSAKRLARLGIQVLPGGAGVPVSNALVNHLRDEEGI